MERFFCGSILSFSETPLNKFGCSVKISAIPHLLKTRDYSLRSLSKEGLQNIKICLLRRRFFVFRNTSKQVWVFCKNPGNSVSIRTRGLFASLIIRKGGIQSKLPDYCVVIDFIFLRIFANKFEYSSK